MPDPGVQPVDPQELSESKPTFLLWYLKQEKNLIEAAQAVFPEVSVQAFERAPQGSWKHKKVIFSGKEPVARYWLSLRRTGTSKKLRVPRFNLECGEQLAEAWKAASLKKDVDETKVKLT
jgi:hypothetical protein